jgi:hypothetical protein
LAAYPSGEILGGKGFAAGVEQDEDGGGAGLGSPGGFEKGCFGAESAIFYRDVGLEALEVDVDEFNAVGVRVAGVD